MFFVRSSRSYQEWPHLPQHSMPCNYHSPYPPVCWLQPAHVTLPCKTAVLRNPNQRVRWMTKLEANSGNDKHQLFKIIRRRNLLSGTSFLGDYSYSFQGLRVNVHYTYRFLVFPARVQVQAIIPRKDFWQLQLQEWLWIPRKRSCNGSWLPNTLVIKMITCNYFCFGEWIFRWLQLQLHFLIPSRIDSWEM